MTLDEAIQLYTQRAENHEYILHSGEFIGAEGKRMKQDIKRCVSENRQLAEWLTELKEAKRLLKLTLDDLNFESQCQNCKHKEYGLNTVCKGCRRNKYEWRNADEAKKLIEGNENE